MLNAWSILAVVVMFGCIVYPFLRRAMVSLSLCVGLFIIYMIELASDNTVLFELAFSPGDFQSGAALYTSITSTFLHANLLHIIMNVIWLALLGLLFEERMGRVRFLVIYLVSGLAGSIAYGILNLGENSLAVGASGAIFGVLGAVLILYPYEKTGMMVLPIPVPNASVWMIAVFMLAFQMIFLLDPAAHVAWQAHLGGFLAGIALARPLMKLRSTGLRPAGQTIDIMQLANTPKEKDIASKIKSESIPQVRDAWLEEFAKTAKCPRCQQSLRASRDGLECSSGHKFRV